jgi:hypothetical protein
MYEEPIESRRRLLAERHAMVEATAPPLDGDEDAEL